MVSDCSEFNKQNQMKKKLTNPLNNTRMKSYLTNHSASCFFEKRNLKMVAVAKNIFFFMLLVSFQNSQAQIGNVTVHVVDELEKPLAGVLVGSESNPEISGITNSDGTVVLNTNPTGFIKLYFNEIIIIFIDLKI